ncbi:anoctamin-9-like [Hemiscyllium ocellatum]|uniref:anoctamin-9-like n=1 Tax=Hemiscyllium ocellatum TaxID=170820 RepID=UPI00296622D5|nr:anoctamin-9-like [Hemiscyllium ocellatum]
MTEIEVEPHNEEKTEYDIQERQSANILSSVKGKVKSRIRKGAKKAIKLRRLNKIANLKQQPTLRTEIEDYSMNDELIYAIANSESEILVPENEELLAKVDFVLVTNKSYTGIDKHEMERLCYLKKLKDIGFNIMKKENDLNQFFGIQAPDKIFEKYIQLLNIAERTCSSTGLETISKSTRLYFGERLALYFAWLGWYTIMLIPAAVCGFIIFIYGLIYFGDSQVSKEVCNAHTIIMCPRCDQTCPLWRLSDTCFYAKITQLFDQEITVFFAMFMGIWATVFLELWKRARAKVVSEWDLYHWDEDEEELALGLIYDPDVPPTKYQHSYLRATIVLILGFLLIAVIIGIALGIVIFRIVVNVILTKSSVDFVHDHANSLAVIISAMLHLLTIIIMTKVNYLVARKLSELERMRTVLARENSFTVKMFTFQFFTMFTSIVYIAFFLGRINGHPGNYVRVANKWRLEECHPSGCMADLLIQMSMIMVLKQLLNTTMEYTIPILKFKWRKKSMLSTKKVESVTKHWIKNYSLNEFNSYSFFNEFLEMAIQYGFTTIFVAAFPLAPLLAFLNNLFEIRLDAKKMIWLLRRPIPRKAKDIGIWLDILEVIGVLAIIGNGLVISITSDFIPRQVYKYGYGYCAHQKKNNSDCLTGYVNNSLSVFHLKDFENKIPLDHELGFLELSMNHCRYRDYRNDYNYEHTVQFWHIFAARLAFLLLFENIAICIKFLAAWFIPEVPVSVRNQNLTDTYDRLKEELR